jgi:hypothetical protein
MLTQAPGLPISVAVQDSMQADLSPDGRHAAFNERAASGGLWIYDIERGTHECLVSEGITGLAKRSPDC